MTRFAVGARSQAICDRCGFQYDYLSLKREWNGLRTCYECWEAKHPQLDPIYPPTEPQALLNPRPDRIEPMDVPVGAEFPFLENNLLQGVTQLGIVQLDIVFSNSVTLSGVQADAIMGNFDLYVFPQSDTVQTSSFEVTSGVGDSTVEIS